MCSIFSKEENLENEENINDLDYYTFDIPTNPLITFKKSKIKTRNNIFISKYQNIIKKYKWIQINAFKIYFDKDYTLQCLHIKNKNVKDLSRIILFSQSSNSNLGKILPNLIDLSSFLKINIITYEYNEPKEESKINFDVKCLYCYLNKLEFIKHIILMGIDIGTLVNFSIFSSNLLKITKIYSIILISPCWFFNQNNSKSIRKTNKIKKTIYNIFFYLKDKNIPIFLIHGKNDNVVRYLLSLSLAKRMCNAIEWYPSDGTHFNLINNCRIKFLIKVKKFIYENINNTHKNNPNNRNTIGVFNLKENQLNLNNSNLSDNEINTCKNGINKTINLSNELNMTPNFDNQKSLIPENISNEGINDIGNFKDLKIGTFNINSQEDEKEGSFQMETSFS